MAGHFAKGCAANCGTSIPPIRETLTPGAVGQESRGLEQIRNSIAIPVCDNKFIKLLAVNPAQAYTML